MIEKIIDSDILITVNGLLIFANNLMPLWITLIVLGGIYLLTLFTNIFFVIVFYIIMNKHDHAIVIILKTRSDAILDLINLMKSKNVEIDENLLSKAISINKIISESDAEFSPDNVKKELSYIRDSLLSICSEYEGFVKSDEFTIIDDQIKQLDIVYRSNVIMYNADVLGYNYWIRFLPCRFIWLLLKFKTKDIIS